MTIYCDCTSCLYNEEGFCDAEKVEISDFVCYTATGFDSGDNVE